VVAAFSLYEPKRLPFTLKSIALFILVRSLFITLTHLGPYPDRIPLDIHTMLMSRWNVGNLLTFGSGGDLFFSGHTGLPFLFALIFWKNPRMRLFCLIGAVFFGIVVLLGHLHYSIDVLSAFFITYAIYHIAEWLFKKDRRMFYESPVN
jgi:membrane-associated phospholipid phosphatase